MVGINCIDWIEWIDVKSGKTNELIELSNEFNENDWYKNTTFNINNIIDGINDINWIIHQYNQ